MAKKQRRARRFNPNFPYRKAKADTAADKAAFIAALRKFGMVSKAALKARVDRSTAYKWRDDDTAFAALWEGIIEADTEEMERVARKRAVDRSDILMIFMLKARRPAVYGDRVTAKLDHTSGGKPITPVAGMTTADIEAFVRAQIARPKP